MKYDDIIGLPHHVSKRHPQMSMHDRAGQFAPFAALTGYDEQIEETARFTDSMRIPDEYEIAEINAKLEKILADIASGPAASITYFVPDKLKSGGEYVTASGTVRKIDTYKKTVLMEDDTLIPADSILSIEILAYKEAILVD